MRGVPSASDRATPRGRSRQRSPAAHRRARRLRSVQRSLLRVAAAAAALPAHHGSRVPKRARLFLNSASAARMVLPPSAQQPPPQSSGDFRVRHPSQFDPVSLARLQPAGAAPVQQRATNMVPRVRSRGAAAGRQPQQQQHQAPPQHFVQWALPGYGYGPVPGPVGNPWEQRPSTPRAVRNAGGGQGTYMHPDEAPPGTFMAPCPNPRCKCKWNVAGSTHCKHCHIQFAGYVPPTEEQLAQMPSRRERERQARSQPPQQRRHHV